MEGPNVELGRSYHTEKSVLSFVPVHTMSSVKLPESITKRLDRVLRDFLWGSTNEKRKQHLVSWEKVCRSKEEGGLGIWKTNLMNKALLATVGWRLMQDDRSVWARVLRNKYRIGDIHEKAWLTNKGTWSSTWRSVVLGIRDVLQPGHTWAMGDGRNMLFWTDKWLLGNALRDVEGAVVPEALLGLTASDLWIDGVGWDLTQIAPHVSENTKLELAAVVVNRVSGKQDKMAWGGTPDGRFTVSSAYRFLVRDGTPRQDMSQFFRRVWRVTAPERVRVFMWLLGNHGIMTNQERFRWHISDTKICQVCKAGIESSLYILRDCPAMSGIWERIVPREKRQAFFTMPLLEWLFVNLSDSSQMESGIWSTLFSVSVWWAWKWRCGNIFGENKLWSDRVKFVKDYAKEVSQAKYMENGGRSVASEDRLVSWSPPLVSWIKLNTDGASHGNPGLATAGDALRGGDGQWRGGFALNIGRCTAHMAELWGLYYGLCIAWEKGFTRLEVEVDSSLVVGFMKTGICDTHPLSFLVHLCQGFLSKDSEVRITHVYREANRLADGLANYAFSLPFGLHTFDLVPLDLLPILRDDESGDSRLRQVRV
ncbi:unnamed protein product [Microthlaspi erraticum]|uniref:RNase H type-1 domain-containing protein n=1 Tax=Microthlaspi erraticum TaxID=1685480 RepID=A0A6D2KKM3_9BRAS|nr:unnamed protein product [Microthlaspi erraticum]